jgi:hypothetical protein
LPRYEIHLPLAFNDGGRVPDALFIQVRDELIEKFGGLNVLSPGSPTQGWWKSGAVVYRDDILIYRVTTSQDEDNFFQSYKIELARRFQQEEVWIEREETRRL